MSIPEPIESLRARADAILEGETLASPYPLPTSSPGDWLVIFGTFTEYQDTDLRARLGTLAVQGTPAVVVRSGDYPNLMPGLGIVFVGPYTQRAAKAVSDDLKPVIPDVYSKSGW